MPTILDKIAAYKRIEVTDAKASKSLGDVESAIKFAGPTRGFATALRSKLSAGHWALIAEIKKASPSKGLIRADFEPHELAMSYASGGAACLSVLTDGPSFQGSPAYLSQVRAACALPALCKDFMLDPYQIAAAREWGADAILVIMAMVDDELAAELEHAAFGYGMDVLIEVHNEAELERGLKLKSELIGINNRDLHSFETTLSTTERLAPLIPTNRLVVGESGLFTAVDLARLSHVGVETFLIGESLMRQADVALATRNILTKPKDTQ